MNASTFLAMERAGDDLHWCMEARPDLSTPEAFLFGGCGLGAALVDLEAASDRPTVWANGHFLSYARCGSTVEWEVTLAAVGGRMTQGRAVARVGGRPTNAQRDHRPRCSTTRSMKAWSYGPQRVASSRRWTGHPASPTRHWGAHPSASVYFGCRPRHRR
jgi:hypothetical protein